MFARSAPPAAPTAGGEGGGEGFGAAGGVDGNGAAVDQPAGSFATVSGFKLFVEEYMLAKSLPPAEEDGLDADGVAGDGVGLEAGDLTGDFGGVLGGSFLS